MAARALTTFLRHGVNANKVQTRCYYTIHNKIGNREIVGPGMNQEPHYLDVADFPMPAIRYKEITPDIQALKDKEKGDWKKLSIDEKKQLYRASFRQTFAEMEAPGGEWKSMVGITCLGITVSIWFYIWVRKYVYAPLPDTFSEERQLAQLERMRLIDNQPISGLPYVKRIQ